MVLHYKSTKSVEEVYGFLSDMDKFVTVHPVIFRIDPIAPNKFKFYERLKLLFLPYTFTYITNMSTDPESKKVIMEAVVNKVIHIRLECAIEDKDSVTFITETLQFRSFLPVNAVMCRIFKAQHKLLFENIERS